MSSTSDNDYKLRNRTVPKETPKKLVKQNKVPKENADDLSSKKNPTVSLNDESDSTDESDDKASTTTSTFEEENSKDDTNDGMPDTINSVGYNPSNTPLKVNEQPQSAPEPSKPNNAEKNSVSGKKNSAKESWMPMISILIVVAVAVYYKLSSNKTESSIDSDWRSKVDPENYPSSEHQSMIRASLKPILDKPSTRQDESISTLLILSSNEDTAAQLARCLLPLVNKETTVNQESTIIDLRSYAGDKSELDSNLRTLLDSNDPARAVLLRGINHIPSEHLLERLRLLFGYCDGENPVIADRLFILTATSPTENNLRETFKNALPAEHDFVDALMSRISGHTIYIENDQKSIC